ncbi:MAG: hypothetical protein CL749_04410 [Chloroflexi bacterium]|nr:hypothetical protein [Chloroflexota bacterium]
MPSVTELLTQPRSRPFVVLDFSPPRGGIPHLLSDAFSLTPDLFSIAYNPGKSVRANPIMVAHWIQNNTGIPAVFTLATRDMNKRDLQGILLGAQLIGLDNVVSVMGDELKSSGKLSQKTISDFTASGFVSSIKQMNTRVDFRDRFLRHPTGFCVGATIDLSRDWSGEIPLTRKKVTAGADFFLSQPVFDTSQPEQFMERYFKETGCRLETPVMWGVQVKVQDSVSLVPVPDWVHNDLEQGRSGFEIALQIISEHTDYGFDTFYLVPPILRGGTRDYESAQAVIDEL